MKLSKTAALAGILTIFLNSCVEPYTNEPEGYVTSSVPYGYEMLMLGGVSYWAYNNHYYRYWPNYGYVVVRPPQGRPPYQRPPSRPPGQKPPGTKPPGQKPPGQKPPSIQPLPSTRPNTPVTRPSMPSTRPSMPTTRPSMPRSMPARGGRR